MSNEAQNKQKSYQKNRYIYNTFQAKNKYGEKHDDQHDEISRYNKKENCSNKFKRLKRNVMFEKRKFYASYVVLLASVMKSRRVIVKLEHFFPPRAVHNEHSVTRAQSFNFTTEKSFGF